LEILMSVSETNGERISRSQIESGNVGNPARMPINQHGGTANVPPQVRQTWEHPIDNARTMDIGKGGRA
jgi:hypothetical protein